MWLATRGSRDQVTRQEIESLARQFLAAYASKDIERISDMFDEMVILRDWNYEVVGFDDALVEFKKNFDEAQTLELDIKNIFTHDSSAAVEQEVVVNRDVKLHVVDVISFNAVGKVTSVVAYKGL